MSYIMQKIAKHEKFNQADFEEYMQKMIDSGNCDEFEKKEIELTVRGGECPLCRLNWKKIERREKYSEYDYYSPVCSCFDKPKDEINLAREEIKFNEKAGIPRIYWKASLKSLDRNIRNDTLKTVDAIIEYIKQKRYAQKGLVLFGNDSGTGKTMLTIAVMKTIAVRDKKSALFVDCSKLEAELIRDKDYLFRLLDHDIVLLDDIDKSTLGRKDNEWSQENFFTIINCLTENKKIILITSNIDTKERFIQTYSALFADRVSSRLLAACEFMRITGDNYRLKGKEDLL